MTYLREYMLQNKTKDLNIHIYNMIAGKKWVTNLTKDVWCQRKCRFDRKNVIQTIVEKW